MACLPELTVGAAVTVGAKYVEKGVIAVVKHCCCYMCCFKKFQKELNEEESAVSVVQQDLQRRLEREKMNTRRATETAKKCSTDTTVAIREVHVLKTTMEQDQHCLNNSCPNWYWRYKKAKEADGLITTLKKLKDEHSRLPQEIAHEADLPNIGFIQSDGFMPSKASEFALGEIMTALETDDVNIIGLHGMPGAGKTTLAKQVRKEATEKKLFDEYLIVTVAEKPDITRIQSRLAEQMQVVLDEMSSTQHKASRLMLRLQDDKTKLLVLDDVWGELSLTDIGIPPVPDLNKCKILLTTRRIPTCDAMKCKKTILLDILTENEAWDLFQNAANLNDGSLTDVAKMVANECSRLPLAIMSVGRALRGKTKKNSWVQALKKLREGEMEEIRDIDGVANVYRSLKYSFDALKREETKRCLLLCAFFPEDYAIFVPQLTDYAIQLGICKHSNYPDIVAEFLEEVDELKNSHLLQESEILEGAFIMHDLARDVVLKLGKRYSVLRDPTAKILQKESRIVQKIIEKHFTDDTPNESFTADVSIAEFIESQELVLYKSAESALVQIVKALQTDGINIIGLHGLTGVGKTSWAKQVANVAVRTKVFDECVFIPVSRISDIRDIQSGISRDLKLGLEEGSSTEKRATELRKRLSDEKKKILVLDDVWEELNLNEIGIPSVGNLKILITTPIISVCKAMKCKRKILLEPLAKDEERSLIDKIKNSMLEESHKFAANKITEQFMRYPGALKVGKLIDCQNGSESTRLQSIQDERNSHLHKMQLIWQVLSVEQKRCMLLCCLYTTEEDEEISVEELGRYAHILGIYGSTQSIQYTMKRLMEAIDKLSDYHFLFLSTRDRHIQLHAAGRDYALRSDESRRPF